MVDNRKYTEVLASVETHIIYINNHLGNIDQHLEKLNTTNQKQELKINENKGEISKNKGRIGLLFKIGGGVITILCGAFALILKILGIY